MPRSPRALRLAPLASLVLALLCAAPGAQAQNTAVAPTPAQVAPEVEKTFTQLMAAPAIQWKNNVPMWLNQRSTWYLSSPSIIFTS